MFNPYPWQKKSWQLLVNQVRQDHLAHALLLHGVSGLGKRDFSRAFAAYVLCDDKKETACGRCQSCRWFQAGSHPDFFRVALEEKSKSIKVDQLRVLTQALEKTSQRGGYQVAVIESADTMNRAAANALLKTLEEPVGSVLIMLVVDRLHALPATVVSRCQTVGFFAGLDSLVLDWLEQRVGAQSDSAFLLKLAEHAPLRALDYVERDYLGWRDQLLRHLLRVQCHEVDPISIVSEFLKQELTFILMILMSLVSDVLRLLHGIPLEKLVHSDRLAQLQSLANAQNIISWHEYFQSCQKTLASVQSGIHLNPQLLLENLLIQYCRFQDAAC